MFQTRVTVAVAAGVAALVATMGPASSQASPATHRGQQPVVRTGTAHARPPVLISPGKRMEPVHASRPALSNGMRATTATHPTAAGVPAAVDHMSTSSTRHMVTMCGGPTGI
jgi:hypothetical protein